MELELEGIALSPDEELSFNGINGRSGGYLFPPLSTQDLANLAQGKPLAKASGGEAPDATALEELKARTTQGAAHLGAAEGVDVRDLAEAGWAVIFPAAIPDSEEAKQVAAVREALRPLLEHRRAQAGRYYREYGGGDLQGGPYAGFGDGYRNMRGKVESKQDFLTRLGAGPGPAVPERVPYYLLIVGSPDQVPFRVQYQLDVQYAVGRIHFETLEEYRRYALSVVEAETRGLQLPRELAFFGVSNPDDRATQLSAQQLVTPLADLIEPEARAGGWSIGRHMVEEATKQRLSELMGGGRTPALLFTASHGIGFDRGDPLQERRQGALICQDWPGPKRWQEAFPERFYFSGEDLTDDLSLHGLIAFNFACYGAGTPQFDEFSPRGANQTRKQLADRSFVSALHRRMLSHPGGGALAAIGHVDRAWEYSFIWRGTGRKTGTETQIAAFSSVLKRLLDGYPVGAAVEFFNERYAELASDLSVLLDEIGWGSEANPYALAGMWTSNNDAKCYAIVGDPAVRLMVAPAGKQGRARERLELGGTASHVSVAAAGGATDVAAAGAEGAAAVGATGGTVTAGAMGGAMSDGTGAATGNTAAGGATGGATAGVTAGVAGGTAAGATGGAEGGATGGAAGGATGSGTQDATTGDGASFGLFDRKNTMSGESGTTEGGTDGKSALEEAGRSIRDLTKRLLDALGTAVDDLTTLEVRTYVSDDMAAVSSASREKLDQAGELRAITRIELSGDVQVCVPYRDGALDTSILELHQETVRQAQAHRMEVITALASILTKLGPL